MSDDRVELIPIDRIRIDGQTQVRAKLNEAALDRYTEAYREYGDKALDPVYCIIEATVLETNCWLVDGFTRRQAAINAGLDKLWVKCKPGTLRDARFEASQVNTRHGVPLNDTDWGRAVVMFLESFPGPKVPDNRMIGKALGISHTTVSKYRRIMGVSKPTDVSTQSDLEESDAAAPLTLNETQVPAPDSEEKKGQDGLHNKGSDRIKSKNKTPDAILNEGRVFDSLGDAVPHRLKAVFSDIPEIMSLLNEIKNERVRFKKWVKSCVQNVREKQAYYPWIPAQQIDLLSQVAAVDVWDRVEEIILAGLPYAVCPACRGKGGDCKVCAWDGFGSSGYLPKWRYEENRQNNILELTKATPQ